MRRNLERGRTTGQVSRRMPAAAEPGATNAERKSRWVHRLIDCIALLTHTHAFRQVAPAPAHCSTIPNNNPSPRPPSLLRGGGRGEGGGSQPEGKTMSPESDNSLAVAQRI